MYFNFTSTMSVDGSSRFLSDVEPATSKYTLQNYNGSGIYGSTITVSGLGVGSSGSGTTNGDSYSDITTFTRIISSKISAHRYNFDTMGTLVNVSEESTFQLSLENIVPDSFIHYNDIYNQYGFSSSVEGARTASRQYSGILVGNAFGMLQKNEFFDWTLKEEPIMDSYSFCLEESSPFFEKFHNEMIPYIKREVLNQFLELGMYFYGGHFTIDDIKDDKVHVKCKLHYMDIQVLMGYYLAGTKYLFEYQKYYPHAFEGYRKVYELYFLS